MAPHRQILSHFWQKHSLAHKLKNHGICPKENRMILGEARERAKLIIERNIKAAGEAQGKQYTVNFVDAEAAQ